MRNARLAESILALVISRERAASFVGDLIEDESTGSFFHFWTQVARTVLSVIWRDISADPFTLAGVVLRAMVKETIWGIALFSVVIIGGIMAGVVFSGLQSAASAEIGYAGFILGGIGYAVVEFQIGVWLARQVPGREAAVCAAKIIISLAIGPLLALGYSLVSGKDVSLTNMMAINPEFMIANIFCVAGAISVRRRQFENLSAESGLQA